MGVYTNAIVEQEWLPNNWVPIATFHLFKDWVLRICLSNSPLMEEGIPPYCKIDRKTHEAFLRGEDLKWTYGPMLSDIMANGYSAVDPDADEESYDFMHASHAMLRFIEAIEESGTRTRVLFYNT